ncbi:MAG: hypothetical protein MUE44_09245 [Oscillatoriaceae cyanobacterium Prado104]|nr:hypothetical protein [Oscillatoriaceae cyanobacterium Prado104]
MNLYDIKKREVLSKNFSIATHNASGRSPDIGRGRLIKTLVSIAVISELTSCIFKDAGDRISLAG